MAPPLDMGLDARGGQSQQSEWGTRLAALLDVMCFKLQSAARILASQGVKPIRRA